MRTIVWRINGRGRFFAAVLVWAAVLIPAACMAGFAELPAEHADIAVLERAVYDAFYRGDYYKLYDAIETMLVQYPDHPQSMLLYSDIVRLADVCGYEKARTTLESLLEMTRRRDDDHTGMRVLALTLELEKLYAIYDRERAAKLAKELSPLRNWLLIGPYRRYGAGDLRHPFLPEIVKSFDDPGFAKKKVLCGNLDGVLRPGNHIYPEKGIVYAFTGINAPYPFKIRIYSRAHYRLFINGREAICNSEGGTFRSCRIVRVSGGGEPASLLVKIENSSTADMRIIVTDDSDAILGAENCVPRQAVFSDIEFCETLDYPAPALIESANRGGNDDYFRLGNYFSELESREAVTFYKKAAGNGNPLYLYFLAQSLIDASHGDASSSEYLEGWRIFQEVAAKNMAFVPARFRNFQKLIERKNLRGAVLEGRAMRGIAGGCLPFRRDYTALLGQAGYEKEFLDEVKWFQRDFPASSEPVLVRAEYYAQKNPERAAALYETILSGRFDGEIADELVALYRESEKNDAIIKIADKFNSDGRYSLDLIDAMIRKGAIDDAKREIFKNLAIRGDPAMYCRLGDIYRKTGHDPVMEWRRAMKLAPSDFTTGDLLDYILAGKIENPFAREREKIDDSMFKWPVEREKEVSSRVLHRAIIIHLNEDGGSRAFCEDVLYIGDSKGVEKWGDYRTLFQGELCPLRTRVYRPDGSYYDSYSLQKIDRADYINLSSLKDNSIVHVAYIVNNPFAMQGDPALFSVPLTRVQDYDEPVDYFSLQVAAPAGMSVTIYGNPDADMSVRGDGDRKIYTMRLVNLPALRRERNSGSSGNCPRQFAVTTMAAREDFIAWYNGLLRGRADLRSDDIGAVCTGSSVDDVIQSVYEYVSRDIDLRPNVLYYPEKAATTLYNRSGTPEDKTVLAKSILEARGIRSYIAFARRNDMPDPGAFTAPSTFTNILLYVPISTERGAWLDFSNRFRPYGIVDDAIRDVDALVIIRDGYEVKKIQCEADNVIRTDFMFYLNDDGGARCDIKARFEGNNATIRKYFTGRMYREETVNAYFGSILPGLSIDTYALENLESVSLPFIVSARGYCVAFMPPIEGNIMLQPVVKKSDVARYIQSATRQNPLYIEKNLYEDERYEYELGDEFRSVEYGEDLKTECRYGYARISIYKNVGSTRLSVTKVVRIRRAVVEKENYGELVRFCAELRKNENATIILRK